MTKGPIPATAIRKAIKNAAARGLTMDMDMIRESQLMFILFCEWITVFVRIRRTRRHFLTPDEAAAEYRHEILLIRRIPLTAVATRELWLLSPWGAWQYFRILDDRVIEIRADGVPLLRDGPGFPPAVTVGNKLPQAAAGTSSSPSGGDT